MSTYAYRDEFPVVEQVIYLNHAGVGPWPRRTLTAIRQFADENVQWGATHYPEWLKTEAKLREQLRDLIHAPSVEDIALVKNTSEAISFVAAGMDWRRGENIVTASEEFPSNRIPWEALAIPKGVELRRADLRGGLSPEDALFALVDNNTRMIAVSSVQYASGLRLDSEKVGQFCRAHGILYCLDAIQTIGAAELDVVAAGVDFAMADGHKWMLGPEGLGMLYTTPQARELLHLTEYGWHMVEHAGSYDNPSWAPAHTSRRFECGSPNLLGIFALSASLSLLQSVGMAEVEQRVLERTNRLLERIQAEPELELLSPTDPRLRSGIVVFRHRQADSVALDAALRKAGVAAAARGGGVRFSPHFYTPLEQLDAAIDCALRLAKTLN